MASWNERRSKLDWTSECAQLYHTRRHSFLDAAEKTDSVLSVVFGSAAFGSAVASLTWLAAFSALIVAAYSAANLSFGFAACAQKHRELVIRWGKFRNNLNTLQHNDLMNLSILEEELENIHAESPQQLILLSAICEDSVRETRGQERLIHPSRFAQILSNFLSLTWSNHRK
jgi:hypothetical protein